MFATIPNQTLWLGLRFVIVVVAYLFVLPTEHGCDPLISSFAVYIKSQKTKMILFFLKCVDRVNETLKHIYIFKFYSNCIWKAELQREEAERSSICSFTPQCPQWPELDEIEAKTLELLPGLQDEFGALELETRTR